MTATKAKQKAAPFRHADRELAILNRAHNAYMDHLRAGHRYDVVKLAWVDANGKTVAAA